jgi:hypothetical protein
MFKFLAGCHYNEEEISRHLEEEEEEEEEEDTGRSKLMATSLQPVKS